MDHITVSLTLDPDTLAALDGIAREERCGRADVIRGAIRRDLFRRSRAKRAEKPDERLVAPLRALLADDLAYASSWADLQTRLGEKGFRLIAAGAGLSLIRLQTGERVAKASDLGCSHGRLARRFGCAFPDPPNPQVAAALR